MHVAERYAIRFAFQYAHRSGRYHRSVFINTALTLWAFEISEDPAHPIDTMGIKDGALAHPCPFVVRFKPRISNLREKILSHVE